MKKVIGTLVEKLKGIEWKGLNATFIIKMSVTAALILLAFSLFMNRYFIGYDPQEFRCLPDHAIYITDKKDKELERGEVYAFHAKGLSPIYEDGVKMVKILVGMPGDTVEIDAEGRILVNDIEVSYGLSQAGLLNKKPDDFIGKAVLGEGKYWFLGTAMKSFDSRYWGSVDESQIIGKTYGIY